jgi:monoamine oxidase
MKALVIGAGISGLGTAQALSSDGHEITVIDKRKALPTAGAALTLWSKRNPLRNAARQELVLLRGVPQDPLGEDSRTGMSYRTPMETYAAPISDRSTVVCLASAGMLAAGSGRSAG